MYHRGYSAWSTSFLDDAYKCKVKFALSQDHPAWVTTTRWHEVLDHIYVQRANHLAVLTIVLDSQCHERTCMSVQDAHDARLCGKGRLPKKYCNVEKKKTTTMKYNYLLLFTLFIYLRGKNTYSGGSSSACSRQHSRMSDERPFVSSTVHPLSLARTPNAAVSAPEM